ncbi:hypothetical protein FS842_007342, partial [Serendipita sp. 407]
MATLVCTYCRTRPTTPGHQYCSKTCARSAAERYRKPNNYGPENPDKRPLPTGWIMQFDKTHDAWFYVNTVAHPPTTTWEHPAANADALQTQTYEAPASSGPPAATGNMGGNIDFSRESALVVCDMQEEYRRSVHHFSSVLATAVRMIRFAKLVGVQVFLTKGRPSIYGSTVHEIEHEIAQLPPGLFGGSFTKTKFLGDSVELTDSLRSKRFRHAMFCGVEAHIGVRAQATELLKQGMIVHVLLDGISSRNKEEVSPFITLMRDDAHLNKYPLYFIT